MKQTLLTYLTKLHVVVFGVIVCCFFSGTLFSSTALASSPQDNKDHLYQTANHQHNQSQQFFLFARSKCLTEDGAPYSIAATTFDPVIYNMSISDEDETLDFAISLDDAPTGCKQEAVKVSVINTSSCSALTSQVKHIDAHTTEQGVFIPASIELELPAEPSNSCSSSQGPDRCEDHPPLPTLTVVKISQASAWYKLMPQRHPAWQMVGKVRRTAPKVQTTLSKGPANHRGHPSTPPPQMG